MIKFFTYQFEMHKYKGYKLLSEKGVFASFQKIQYAGFKILYSTSEFIHYQIDTQIIRKLKLKKIDNSIKRNSIEERLSQLLDRSEEKDENEFKNYGNYFWTYSGSFYSERYTLPSTKNEDFIEKRNRNKYHANKYKNRI
jgi:hypothetical protein